MQLPVSAVNRTKDFALLCEVVGSLHIWSECGALPNLSYPTFDSEPARDPSALKELQQLRKQKHTVAQAGNNTTVRSPSALCMHTATAPSIRPFDAMRCLCSTNFLPVLPPLTYMHALRCSSVPVGQSFLVTVRRPESFTDFNKTATNAGNPVHYAHQLVHILLSVWKAQVVEHESYLEGSANTLLDASSRAQWSFGSHDVSCEALKHALTVCFSSCYSLVPTLRHVLACTGRPHFWRGRRPRCGQTWGEFFLQALTERSPSDGTFKLRSCATMLTGTYLLLRALTGPRGRVGRASISSQRETPQPTDEGKTRDLPQTCDFGG